MTFFFNLHRIQPIRITEKQTHLSFVLQVSMSHVSCTFPLPSNFLCRSTRDSGVNDYVSVPLVYILLLLCTTNCVFYALYTPNPLSLKLFLQLFSKTVQCIHFTGFSPTRLKVSNTVIASCHKHLGFAVLKLTERNVLQSWPSFLVL